MRYSPTILQRNSAFQCTGQSHLVGILQLTAHRNSIGKPGNLHPKGTQQPTDIHCRCLALGIGIGCHNDLFHILIRDSLEQLPDFQVLRTHVSQRRNDAVEHMIAAMILPRLLHGGDVLGVRHHADDAVVPGFVLADRAKLLIRQVLAPGAGVDRPPRL